jgi:hypothetical protein
MNYLDHQLILAKYVADIPSLQHAYFYFSSISIATDVMDANEPQ